jgi:hypothetical protein
VGAGALTLLVLFGLGLALAILLGRGDSTPHSFRVLRRLVWALFSARPSPFHRERSTLRSERARSGFLDRVVATVKTPGTEDYSHIAVGLGAVWVTADGGRPYRIDPTTNRVVAAILVGGPIQGVEVGGGYVWVTRPAEGDGELIRVDPTRNRVTGAPIDVGPGPVAALYSFGALWVTNSSVVRVDPSTGKVSTMGFSGRVAPGLRLALGCLGGHRGSGRSEERGGRTRRFGFRALRRWPSGRNECGCWPRRNRARRHSSTR